MPKNDFDIVRNALVNYGTWRMQKPRREKALVALDRIAERLEIETGAAEIALAEAARQIRDLEKERDILFKGDWAALNQKLEIAEREWKRWGDRAVAAEARVAALEKFLAHVNDGRLDKAIKLVESDLPLEGIRRERLLGRLLNIRDHAKQIEK